jgi:peptide/nickel transport system permease protein
MPGTLAAVAGLSFLGLGGSPPTADWGVLLQLSRKYLYYAPWEVFVPSFVIFLVAFSFNIVGETLRDIVDPRRKYLRIF